MTNDIRKFINILVEASLDKDQASGLEDPKIKEIAKDIKQGEVPQTVIGKLKHFLVSLLDPTPPPSGQYPEPPIEEADKQPKIVSADLQIYELLKRTKPEDADKVWAFYNRAMIADHIIPMCIAKDIVKQDDQDRILNLFINSPGTLEDKVSLAAQLESGGVIKTKELLKAGSGSIDKLINYKSVVLDNIKTKLINFKVSPSTTAVNTGDGEAFFLILGSGINKLSPGDLNVLGREIEVKAQGARLKGFGGKGTYGDGATYWPKFNKELISLIKKPGVAYLQDSIGVDLTTEPLHFGSAATTALSKVLEMTKPGAQAVKDMFNKALMHIYPKTTPDMRNNVLDTIQSNGSFNPEEFRKGWFMLTYEYYMATSVDKKTGVGFDGILFIHQPTFTYNYVKDKEQIERDWEQFELNPGLYNWTDAPSVAPKITFGKEERSRKSKTKSKAIAVPGIDTDVSTHNVKGLRARKGSESPVQPDSIPAPRQRR